MNLFKKEKGFTLIELLIVVSIIIIFASVVLVMMTASRKRARDADFKSVVSSIQKAYSIECTKPTGDITAIGLSGGVTRGSTNNCNEGNFSVVLNPPAGVSPSCTSATVTHNGANFTNCP